MAEEKRKRGRPELKMPEQIDAPPEEVARAFMNTPPKKPDEWKYAKRQH